MKSTLVNMVVVLFCITLVASAGVGSIYQVTKEPIEKTLADAEANAVKDVLNGIDFEQVSPADTTYKQLAIYRALKGGEVVAYAVKSTNLTRDGFNGKFTLMVGYTLDGTVNNVAVVEQNETPGLGSNMCKADNPLYRGVVGQNTGEQLAAGKLAVTKDGGEVDALTAATISSRAYLNAVEVAYAAFSLARKADFPAAAEPAAEEVVEQAEPEAQEGVTNE